MGFYRARPPLNRQNLDDSCWAAALDSFSRATAGVPTLRERDLISKFGTGSTGGLNLANLERLRLALAVHGVRVELIYTLTMPYDLDDRLRRSLVVLARQIGPTSWHAWLVYGIDNWVMYMEPRTGSYEKKNWSRGFASPGGYYLFWRP